jgi:glycosyltransferase involved in cell wall biosynthesis
MERLSARGHEIRVIDYEIRWRKHQNKELISHREIFTNVHKAIDKGNITVIRPSIIKLPVLEYLSLIYTHTSEIKRQIEDYKPDIIVGLAILNANIAIRLAKKRCIPFVYYIVDEMFRLVPQRFFWRLARYIEKENMKLADKVLSTNEGLREYSIQMGADRENTKVIGAGIDLERFSRADGTFIREKYGIKNDDVILFFMGVLLDFMGLKEVALELARSDRPNIKLLILGKGYLWDTLQDIKRESGLDGRIIIVDWVPYKEVPVYLAASDICILPAYKNDIMKNIVPIKMYDYMAAGKPVIASSLYGIMKEFSENNGVLYVDRPEDVLKIAIEMAERDSIKEEGKKARRFVEKCSWDSKVKEFEKVLEELIG